MDEHLAFGVKVYDPFIKQHIVENQYLNFADFLNDIEILVIMVGHDHIKENMDSIQNKFIVDTKNIYIFGNSYKL